MSERKPMSKTLRFEVFKRDRFTCQYCGQKAPDVVLHVDHIRPMSKGGTDEFLNLITSCVSCNLGKGARELDDTAIVEKQRAQLDLLAERRDQIDMLLQWKDGLAQIDAYAIDRLAEVWNGLVKPWCLNDYGRTQLAGHIRKYGVEETVDAIRAAVNQYVRFDENNEAIDETVDKAWSYVGRVAGVTRESKDKPYLRDLFYIRGIVRKRHYCVDWRALEILKHAHAEGVEIDELRDIAKNSRNWTEWQGDVDAAVAAVRNERGQNGS